MSSGCSLVDHTSQAVVVAPGIHCARRRTLEGTNSLIQVAKARARGYRNKQYMITTIIYLLTAKPPRPSLWVTHTM